MTSGAMLVLGLGILTGFELLAGQSASLTGGGQSQRPTIVDLFDGGDSGTRGGSERGGQVQDGDGGGSSEPTDPAAPSVPAPTDPAATGLFGAALARNVGAASRPPSLAEVIAAERVVLAT